MTENPYRLFQEALRNPDKVADDTLLDLMGKYPYAQPLRYAWVRRHVLLGLKHESFEQAVLYAPSACWLYDYAHQPVEQIEELEVVSDDYVPFEEDVVVSEAEANEVTGVEEQIVPEVEMPFEEEQQQGEEELAKLMGAGVASDYFVFEQKEQQEESSDDSTEAITAKEEINAENISLYNDDLMPYSFRWWLHKTRLEHADTYQPFATPEFPHPQRGQFDPRKLDEAILDQQIKENIIHFQDPEMKLSDVAKQNPANENIARKESKIIERFIREEPIIQPPSPEQLNTENMARQSAEDNYALVTETLANIYADQGLYLKGIEVFKKLILRYPEKKSYFATRIQELEKNL